MKQKVCDILILIFALIGFYLLIDIKHYQTEFLGCVILIGILLYIRFKLLKYKNNEQGNNPLLFPLEMSKNEPSYYRKRIMTNSEINFLKKLSDLKDKYLIIPQVNLASIIEKRGAKYHSELFRNIDFGIFDKDYNLLLLIELNDKTHTSVKRRDRDLKVKKILSDCQIPLLIFYTYYPNEKSYVLNRISSALNKIENLDSKSKDN